MKTLIIYAEDLYRQPGIADLCLTLQDHHGLDVNLILFLAWYGRYRGTIDDCMLANAISLSSEWATHVVIPLRSARRWLNKDGGPQESLRTRIKDSELAAELLQLDRLQALVAAKHMSVDELSDKSAAIRANLALYLSMASVTLDNQQLLPLIAAGAKAASA